MALLNILTFPDPRLRTKAKPVSEVTDRHRTLIDDMLETMYDAPGIGLAATQVDVHEQVIVIDISEKRNEPQVFINPTIEVLSDETMPFEEGCLSVPEYLDFVDRPVHVRVNALDRNGEPFEIVPDGLLAVCIQHEMDHLQGKLFVDYLSALKRRRVRTKMNKLARAR